jgi:hypothetical protein
MLSLEQAKHEVQSQFNAALKMADSPANKSERDFEDALWAALLGIGRLLLTVYFARQARRWPLHRAYEHAGRHLAVCELEDAQVGTRFGKVGYLRPVGRDPHQPRHARDLPLDRELGLPGGFSQPVVTTLAYLCAQMAFAQARGLFRSIFSWVPSPRAVLRMVDATAKHAEQFAAEAPPPEDDGEVLVILADSKGAPCISSREHARRCRKRKERPVGKGRHGRRQRRRQFPKQRRAPGKKSKNAKMATVGVIYTLRRMPDGKLEGPCNKQIVATFGGDRALFERLHAAAVKRGYGTDKFKVVQFISDGAKPLRLLQEEFFPDAERCLDWIHAVEYLWDVGKAICRHTRRQRIKLEEWVAKRKKLLRAGQVAAVITELQQAFDTTPVTGPGNKYRRKVLTDTIRYFTNNQQAMNYHALRKRDLEISSGVAEGAVRNVVGLRLDGPGMRWGRDRAEAVLQLRCIQVNGQWDAFVQYLALQPDFHLAAQPIPTRPHDAKLQEAA